MSDSSVTQRQKLQFAATTASFVTILVLLLLAGLGVIDSIAVVTAVGTLFLFHGLLLSIGLVLEKLFPTDTIATLLGEIQAAQFEPLDGYPLQVYSEDGHFPSYRNFPLRDIPGHDYPEEKIRK